MFLISNPEEINDSFANMAKEGFGPENETVKAFGRLFWKDLTPENRKLYHWVWPPNPFGSWDKKTHDAETRILVSQEGMYD